MTASQLHTDRETLLDQAREEGRAVLRRLRAREYLRVSKDTSGRMKSTTDQHSDHERDANVNGWDLGEPYGEVGAVSASKHGGKVRKGFGELLTDLEQDRFGADILGLWEPSRGSRRTGEWCTLLDLLEDRGVQVWVSSHQRLYDPANYRDRRSLLEDAIDAESETGKMSVRIRRGHASSASEGKPGGGVPFGYQRVYHPKTKRFAGQGPEPTEAPIVREVFDRVNRGHSFRSIERDFAARGITSRDQLRYVKDANGQIVKDENGDPLTYVKPGVPFSAQGLRAMVARPCYAGLRVHKGVTYEACDTWEPLVDRAVWQGVQAKLSTPESVKGRSGGAKHLLSRIVSCDVCGGHIGPKFRDNTPKYQCRDKSCVRVDEAKLDEYAERVVFGYLARDDVRVKLEAARATGPELDNARGQVAAIQQELDDLYDQGGAGNLSPIAVARMEPGILARKAETEQRVMELSTPDALSALLGQGKLTGWPQDMPMSARRQVLREVLTPDQLGELRLGKATNGAHTPVEDRMVWHRSV
jgi:site-specific DNA recombinase